MGQLSEHFTLEELVASSTAQERGIDNTPSQEIIDALTVLATTLLEPARALAGVPFHVDSGYRCEALNHAVGGADRPGHVSEHEFGRTADCIPEGASLQEVFDKIRLSDLPYDQVIIECNAWIHLGMAAAGATPRREALTASGGPGAWHYERVTA